MALDFAELDKAIEAEHFELTKLGRGRFGYEQGVVLFVPDERGVVEHIFMGLYAARRSQ